MGKRHEEHQCMTKGERKDSSKQDTKDPTFTTFTTQTILIPQGLEHPHHHQQQDCRTRHL